MAPVGSNDLPPCSFCGHPIPPPAERCPHCAQPGLFPNVRAAARDVETAALNDRYDAAKHDALARGVDGILQEFERAVMTAAVSITRPLLELQRLTSHDNELYASYYELTEAGVKLPKGEYWDTLREVTDSALFTGYRKHIKFAALTLNNRGLSNYGDCSMFLLEPMIAHRSSAFEENSVMFMIHKEIRIANASNLPPGFRSTWADRGKLCVAKLAQRVEPSTTPDNYPDILMKQGATSADDAFVEIHVWGPLTIRSIEKVTLFPRRKASSALTNANREKLEKAGVAITEVRP
jgi:hypothetical protein